MDILNKDSLKIIIFRTDRLGDLVLSLPVIENLRQAYPKAQIDLFVNPYTVSLAKLQKNIRYAWPDIYPGFRGLKPLVSWLRSCQYDIALFLYPRPHLALAGFLAAIPVRIGTKYRYYSLLFNRRIPLHRSRSNSHERDLNLQLLQQGLSIPEYKTDTGLLIPEQTHQAVQTLLLKKGIAAEDPYIVIHPGSGGSSLTWPYESFLNLAQMLAGEGYTILLTGTDQDREVTKKIKSSGHKEKIINMAGQLDLARLSALLHRATLVISNSTGPLHLADALGTPVIGLYSPLAGALPHRWGPYHQPQNVLLPARPVCNRCKGEKCNDFNCMNLISADEVYQKVLEIEGLKG